MTETEKKVLAVLTLFLILGIGVRIVQKQTHPVQLKVVPTRELDSIKEKFEENRLKKSQVNINRASQQELEELPGIGPKLAREIIRLRETQGPFTRVEDLLKIKGFGKVRLENLRPYLLVNIEESSSPK